MTYIINPMWFYWINVTHVIRIIAIFIVVFGGMALVIGFILKLGNEEYGEKDADYRAGKYLVKISFVPTIVSLLLCIFLPNKETLIEMQVAKLATVENAQWTLDAIKSAVDYIIQAISSL